LLLVLRFLYEFLYKLSLLLILSLLFFLSLYELGDYLAKSYDLVSQALFGLSLLF
jgi:hypothetical protein